jgi:hypothetical protein
MKFIVGQRVVKEGEDSRFERLSRRLLCQARLEDPALPDRERRRHAAHRQGAHLRSAMPTITRRGQNRLIQERVESLEFNS